MTSVSKHVDVDPRDDLLRLEPYLGDFAEAALLEGEDTALLCAICLRETLAGWAKGYVVPPGQPRHLGHGDRGHGAFLFQFDDRGPYRHLPREAPEASPFLQARWACHVLANNRTNLADFGVHPLFERAVVAAYNAFSFPPAEYAARKAHDPIRRALVLGQDPDHVTAGKDYGSDVLRRRDELRRKHPERFPPPRLP